MKNYCESPFLKPYFWDFRCCNIFVTQKITDEFQPLKVICVKQVYLWDVEKGDNIPQVWGTYMTSILILLS